MIGPPTICPQTAEDARTPLDSAGPNKIGPCPDSSRSGADFPARGGSRIRTWVAFPTDLQCAKVAALTCANVPRASWGDTYPARTRLVVGSRRQRSLVLFAGRQDF